MEDSAQSTTRSDGDDYALYRDKAEGTNINQQTLLATDYLNHFNEITMLIEMIPDMPEMLEEAQAWAPKSYQDHFREAGFSDAGLAVEAYDHVPDKYRRPFERTVTQLNQLILASVGYLEVALQGADPDAVRQMAKTMSKAIQKVQDVASGIIHGRENAMDQSEIDSLLDI